MSAIGSWMSFYWGEQRANKVIIRFIICLVIFLVLAKISLKWVHKDYWKLCLLMSKLDVTWSIYLTRLFPWRWCIPQRDHLHGLGHSLTRGWGALCRFIAISGLLEFLDIWSSLVGTWGLVELSVWMRNSPCRPLTFSLFMTLLTMYSSFYWEYSWSSNTLESSPLTQ